MDNIAGAAGFELREARKAGGLLFCSGQIGQGSDGSVSADPEVQFSAAFAALVSLLYRHGCGIADIVDLTTFHVGYPAHMDTFMAALGKALPGVQSAWTAIGVAALGYPGSLVEIKAIARMPAMPTMEAADATA